MFYANRSAIFLPRLLSRWNRFHSFWKKIWRGSGRHCMKKRSSKPEKPYPKLTTWHFMTRNDQQLCMSHRAFLAWDLFYSQKRRTGAGGWFKRAPDIYPKKKLCYDRVRMFRSSMGGAKMSLVYRRPANVRAHHGSQTVSPDPEWSQPWQTWQPLYSPPSTKDAALSV